MASSTHQSAWSKSIPVREQIHIIGRLFRYAAPYKWYFYFSVVFAIAVSIVNILLPQIIQRYMDAHLVVGHPDFQVMWFFAGLYFFGMVMKALMQFSQTYLYEMGAEYMLENTRRKLFSKLHTLGMRYFDQTPSGSILSRLTNDTMAFSNFWALFSSLVVTVSAMVSSFIAMLLADKVIALWLLVFMPFLAVTVWYYQRYSTRVYRRMRERLSLLNAKLAEGITGISVIQQFRQEKRVNHEFNDTNDQYYSTRRAMIRINSLLLNPIINLFYALGSVMVLGMFGIRGLHGYVAAGVIYAFVTYLDNFYNPMSNMMDRLSDFQDGVVAGSRVLRIMDDQTLEPQQHPVKGATITRGKTSTINILMRFYEYGSGEILIDDRNIRDYPIQELRQKLGLVLQEPFMFYGTISSNIRMFNDQISDEAVKRAAQFVQADHFIEALPDQYDSRVIERGASYSSGQRQLISFARTLVTDPKILILDEATANIDTETEQLIQTALAKLQEGRTTIAIAHRLSTIQNADLILVLKKGRIVERGTNDELLKKKGYYYDMIRLQNSAHLN